MSDPTEIARFRQALTACGPNDMMVYFRRYREASPADAHAPHADTCYHRVPFDDGALAEVMERCNREFGDPTRVIGGPKLPPVVIDAGRR